MKKSLSFADWPAADQQMWLDLRQHGGPFDDRGALEHLRETSLRVCLRAYGRWLEWLRLDDLATLAESPIGRATLPRLRAWLASMAALNSTSRLMFFKGTLRVLRAAAPDTDWSAHRRVGLGLQRLTERGTPKRKQGKILSSRVLLEAGLRHAGPESMAAPTPLARAKAQRDGTMVAFLATTPLRHRAFTGLKIGQSLLITGSVLTVVLSEDLTKNGVAWEAIVPEPAASVLRQYLERARPFLMGRTGQHHDVLWVGNNGEPMSYSYIGKRIPDITGRLTGVRIPPHFFRDAAATTLARESSNAARLISPVLGHAASGIAEKHYIQAGSVEVGRAYANVMKRLKEKR